MHPILLFLEASIIAHSDFYMCRQHSGDRTWLSLDQISADLDAPNIYIEIDTDMINFTIHVDFTLTKHTRCLSDPSTTEESLLELLNMILKTEFSL